MESDQILRAYLARALRAVAVETERPQEYLSLEVSEVLKRVIEAAYYLGMRTPLPAPPRTPTLTATFARTPLEDVPTRRTRITNRYLRIVKDPDA